MGLNAGCSVKISGATEAQGRKRNIDNGRTPRNSSQRATAAAQAVERANQIQPVGPHDEHVAANETGHHAGMVPEPGSRLAAVDARQCDNCLLGRSLVENAKPDQHRGLVQSRGRPPLDVSTNTRKEIHRVPSRRSNHVERLAGAARWRTRCSCAASRRFESYRRHYAECLGRTTVIPRRLIWSKAKRGVLALAALWSQGFDSRLLRYANVVFAEARRQWNAATSGM